MHVCTSSVHQPHQPTALTSCLSVSNTRGHCHTTAMSTTAPHAVDAPAFVGDGSFHGDGGHLLQQLWDAWPWSPMRVHCPGRYRLLKRVGLDLDPQSFLSASNLYPDDWKMLEISPTTEPSPTPGKTTDTAVVCILRGGGGLITYVKSQPHDQRNPENANMPRMYIHTFNTKSNLLRKLKTMNCTEDVFAALEQWTER
eukprot:GFYU01012356.1.p1 GENE.GFYU01012356.1~~GFYU01012356.1.p1  ORF type:complete len:198 (-),score=15.82 GFYU01012356.1:547-1140(-)